MTQADELITAVYADEEGNILDAAGLRGMGRLGRENVPLRPEDLIPLPESADLMLCLLYTSPSPRDRQKSRMPSSA